MHIDLNNRNFSVDLLRIVSVVLVLISHFGLRKYLPLGSEFDGTNGVVIFFMISGYCMSSSLQGRTCKEFIFARLLRLIPALIICATISTVFENLFRDVRPDRLHNFSSYAFNLMCLPSGNLLCDLFSMVFKGRPVQYGWVDGAYWSLLVEFRFYFLLALIFYTLKIKNVALVLALLCGFASLNIEIPFLSKGSDFLAYLCFFAYGLAFRKFINGDLKSILTMALCYLIFSFNCLIGVAAPSMMLDQNTWLTYSFCFIIFSVVIMYCPDFKSNIVRYIGYLTYPLYLLHQDIGFIVIEWVRPMFGHVAAAFVATLVALGLAFLVQRLVDQITIHIKNAWIKKALAKQ